MGILRIKGYEDDQILEQDPYDLFVIDETPRSGTGSKNALLALTVVVTAMAATLALSFKNGFQGREERPFAFVEVKVIGPDGGPVAGALVKQVETAESKSTTVEAIPKIVGVTDTFGEWRRFMRVSLGKEVRLVVVKKLNDLELKGSKTLSVPGTLPENGEIEISGRLQLARPGERGAGAALNLAAQAHSIAAGELESQGTGGDAGESHQKGDDVQSSQGEVVAGAAPSPASGQIDLGRVWIRTGPVIGARGVGIEEDGDRLNQVLKALQQRTQELGLQVDPNSPWQLTLHHIQVDPDRAHGQASSLVLVEGTYGQGKDREHLYSFIRNYLNTPRQTARNILWAVTIHTKRDYLASKVAGDWILQPASETLWSLKEGATLLTSGGTTTTLVQGQDKLLLDRIGASACGRQDGVGSCRLRRPGLSGTRPNKGWEKQSLHYVGGRPGDQVFVSGYAAWPSPGTPHQSGTSADGKLSYWGRDRGQVNVTVIRNGRLIYRTRLTSDHRNPPLLSVQSPPLSRR